MLKKISDMGNWLESKLLKEEFVLMKGIKDKMGEKVPLIKRINQTIDNYRGIFFFLMFIYMASTLYLLWSYAEGSLQACKLFRPVAEFCVYNPTNTTPFYTSLNTRTYCFDPKGTIYDPQMEEHLRERYYDMLKNISKINTSYSIAK